eukprot:1686695-Rhodomonas_salina.1
MNLSLKESNLLNSGISHHHFLHNMGSMKRDFVESVVRSAAYPLVPMVEKESCPQLLVLLLNNIPKTVIESQDSVRVSFMVLKVLVGGFGSANYNVDKPPPKGTKRDQNDYLYNVAPNGSLIVKTYNLIGKGNKGPASEKGACVMPGMVFNTSIFKDQFEVAFGTGDGVVDLPAFSQCIASIQCRSLSSKATTNGGMLQVRKLRLWDAPLVFGSKTMPDTLFACNVTSSVEQRMRFMDSELLSQETGHAVDQDFIQQMLSQTRHVIRIKPTVADGDIGRNADGSLYVQLRDTTSTLGVDISKVRLHDAGDYLQSLGTSEWVENLLRFAMSRKALSVVFTYDSMRQGMGGDDEQIVDGMVTLTLSDMLSMCIRSTPVDAGVLSEQMAAAFFPAKGSAGDFDVFGDDDEGDENGGEETGKVFVVVSRNQCKNTGGAENSFSERNVMWKPVLCHPKASTLWTEGRVVRVFTGSSLVLFFILSSGGGSQ